jgi:F0F1-type ATP synthase membrane subunit b/b'
VTYATVTVLGAGAAGASTEAVNPILPVDNELFWGGLMFLVLWALMKWVFLPPVLRTIQARADILRDDLAAADGARAQAVSESVAYDESLASARAEAMRIIEGARTEAEEERRVLVSAAEAEAARIRSEAAADIAAAKRSPTCVKESVRWRCVPHQPWSTGRLIPLTTSRWCSSTSTTCHPTEH